MGCLGEDFRFFDACEDLSSENAGFEKYEMVGSPSNFDSSVTNSPNYQLWIKTPGSVKERRSRFLNLMGVNLGLNENGISLQNNDLEGQIDRLREGSGAVLRNSGLEDEFYSTRSLISHSSAGFSEELSSDGDFVCRAEILDGGGVCNVDEVQEQFQFVAEQLVTAEDPKCISENFASFQQSMENEYEEPAISPDTPGKSKNKWLDRLRSIACVLDKQRQAEKLKQEDDLLLDYRVQRVKVRQGGKQHKELSALYKGQDIQAHKGSILTMKFSPDGQYLASAGEDGIVRVWKVLEDERSNELDIPEIDPSCLYFTVDQLSQLKPLYVDKEKTAIMRSLRKTSDSACVIFPPKVFRILEKPLHEFYGHSRKILDLSWSKNYHLLSASEDETVRLWQVGNGTCIDVFSHSNYVTSVQFNPVDDNYFMSGSIDGKIRIWNIPGCHVVDWTDIKDIVTAVCYRPDGQGGVVGSMAGECRFYTITGRCLQLEAQICLNGKKKSSCKRVTGFQFCPQDPNKLMVTYAASQVRLFQGVNLIAKYKGQRKAANQLSACFTSDGKQIISACEDSNVYAWNYIEQGDQIPEQPRMIRSYERFITSASVAVPWRGFQTSNDTLSEVLPLHSPSSFSLSQEYLFESFPKGSATWPEEKLPKSSPSSASSAMHKSQYKFLNASRQGTVTSHAWGLVIVTAGWDGRIRSFHNYGLPVCT